MRLLLFGGTGQVGTELRGLALAQGVEVIAPARSMLDLNDGAAIGRIIAAEPWDVVVNAAGYTNVDRAESEESAALVFDGRKGAPYVEGDVTAPLNAYGRSKLAGEHAVRAANPRHVILRTAWVYSPYGKNFVRTILRLAQERDRLTIVDDQHGCPTAARDIAQACIDVAVRCANEPARAPYGIYHFAGAGETTWFEFASAIVELAADRIHRSPQVAPIRTVDYPTSAMRPADGRLDCTEILRHFDVAMRPWREALSETIDRRLTNTEIS
jgi:dTDP-4-dehydrorhamnose reductase